MNWSLEDDVDQKSLISTYAEFAYSALKHVGEKYASDAPQLGVVSAGGNGAIHVRRALDELGKDKTSFGVLMCFSPSWRFYLTRYVPEGYPRKLARRRAIADWFLTSFFTRSKTMFRLYKSKLGLSRLTRRFYEEKIQHNPRLLEGKREVITRDRPLSIDAAMIAGHFDPVSSTPEFVKELVGHDPAADIQQHADDSDDDDSLLNIKVPNWAKPNNPTSSDSDTGSKKIDSLQIRLVFPQDVTGKDKTELRTIREWAEHAGVSTTDIPGKLFCHEESPALSATIIHQFLTDAASS